MAVSSPYAPVYSVRRLIFTIVYSVRRPILTIKCLAMIKMLRLVGLVDVPFHQVAYLLRCSPRFFFLELILYGACTSLTNRDATPDVHGALASFGICRCAPLRHRRRRFYFYFWSHIRLTTDSICYTNRILWTFCISMDTGFAPQACRGLEDNWFCQVTVDITPDLQFFHSVYTRHLLYVHEDAFYLGSLNAYLRTFLWTCFILAVVLTAYMP